MMKPKFDRFGDECDKICNRCGCCIPMSQDYCRECESKLLMSNENL